MFFIWPVLVLLQFRFVASLAADRELLISEESGDVQTAAYGPPAGAPIAFRVDVVHETTVAIRWQPPLSANGLILSYELRIDDDQGYRMRKVSRSPPFFFYRSGIDILNF